MVQNKQERDESGVSSLTVRIPLDQLSRTPSVSPSVTTKAIGMFTDKAVQADQGMIVDKEVRWPTVITSIPAHVVLLLHCHDIISVQVLDAYMVVKLHEAMLDMKEQLQMMEAQVATIAKQKESLERTLQTKTQYIRVSSFVIYAESCKDSHGMDQLA